MEGSKTQVAGSGLARRGVRAYIGRRRGRICLAIQRKANRMPYFDPPASPAFSRQSADSFDLNAPPPPPPPEGEAPDGERVRWLLYVIGWSTNELARRLDITPNTARDWFSGRRPMRTEVHAWLEDLAQLHFTRLRPPNWES
jgi:hypothetical protein